MSNEQKVVADPAQIPDDIREIRRMCIKVLDSAEGKQLMKLLKDYYILKSPVALANYPKSYCYFREGQNSLLRTLEVFMAEEKEFRQTIHAQMQAQGAAE